MAARPPHGWTRQRCAEDLLRPRFLDGTVGLDEAAICGGSSPSSTPLLPHNISRFSPCLVQGDAKGSRTPWLEEGEIDMGEQAEKMRTETMQCYGRQLLQLQVEGEKTTRQDKFR
jgi:hypothetical protein